MSALPAATAARSSFGTASPVIRSLRPPLGVWRASTPVILPPLTVTRTCTGPYWVRTASPVSTCVPRPGPDSDSDPDPDPAGAAALSRADWRDCLYPALV